MNKLITFCQTLRLRQILTVLIAGLSFFFIQAFGNISPAQADQTVKSPYGYYYKGTPDDNVSGRDGNILNQNRNAFDQNKNAYRTGSQDLQQSPRSASQGGANVGDTVKSPYGYYYKGTPDEGVAKGDRNFPSNDNQLVDNARRNIKGAAESVPEATKNLVQSTKQRIGETVDSLTGNPNQPETQSGYYQRREYQDPRNYQRPLDK